MSKALPWLGLVAVGWLAWLVVAKHLENDGALRERIHARELTIAALAKQHHTDTLRVVATRHTTDSILTTDTVWTTDTVVKLIQAERGGVDGPVGGGRARG